MPAQPQNTPIISNPTPIVLDELLIETTDSNKALYDRKFEFGHLHPDNIKFAGFRFIACKPNSYGQMQYMWANGFTAQDSYNAAKDYSGDASAFPIFSRSYRVLRSDYLVIGPLAKGLPFTGIVAVSVSAGGSGYTENFAVSFSGGGGSGAAATAIVSNDAVVRVEITNVGSGYTSAPSVSFSGGAGTGAAATAIIQPVTALLVAEKHSKLPDDDPYTSLYDKVTRIYETLPGPWLNFARNDSVLGPISGKRRAVLQSGQVASITETTRTTYEPREGSAIVFYEVLEINIEPGQPQAGQRYIRHLDVLESYTKQAVGYTGASGALHVTGFEGNAGVEQTPVDEGVAIIEELDLTAIRAALLDRWFSFQTRASISLPNRLASVATVWNVNGSAGSDSHPADGTHQGTAATGTALLSISYHAKATAEGSATLMPDVQPVIEYFSEAGRNLLVTNYVFYAYGNLTEADIIARVKTIIGGSPTITALPVFIPKSHVITCMGQQVSVRADADSDATLSGNLENTSYSWAWGNGHSYSTGATMRTTVIPPTIHGDVTVADSTHTPLTVTATVNASTSGLYKNAVLIVNPITNTPTAVSAIATGEVAPGIIPSTGSATIPTSGLVMVDTTVNLADYGMLLVHAAVADMSQLA